MARIRGRHECRYLVLIPSQVRPEMFLADPRALLLSEVAPMSFIVDDEFYEFAREHSLPDCSVSFLMRAGSWSARNSRSGFVPSSMLADFSDDPDRATRTLLAAGVVTRGKGGGVRIIEGCGLTVVNASAVAEQVTRDKADAEQKRAGWRERKRRQRDAKAAERQEQVTAVVTPESRGPQADVTQGKARIRKKPQVNGDVVPRDIGVTSRSSRARARDFDFNQSARNQVSQSKVVDARAREDDPPPGSPAFRIQVIAAFAGATPAGIEIDDATADALAEEVLRKARDLVPHPLSYVLKAIADESDPCARWLPKRPPAPRPPAARLDWCGECDEIDRTLEVAEDGNVRLKRCPKCSGHAPAWENAS